MKKKLILLLFLQSYISYASIYIKEIKLIGNSRTKNHVILNEGQLTAKKQYTKKELQEARSRILNLEIFSDAKFHLSTKNKKEGYLLEIKVKERWTTIPILKFSSGGGVSETIIGAYDVNLFGRFIELGAQYQQLGERDSGVIWTKFPRLTEKLQLDIQAWKISRIRVKYDQDNEDPVITNGFTQVRDKLYFELSYRKNYNQTWGLFYEYNKDIFENDLEFDNFSQNNVTLPLTSTFNFVGLRFTQGRINVERELYDGQRFTSFIRAGFAKNKINNFQEISAKYELFKRFNKKFNFALRSLYSSNNNTNNPQYKLYFGGLDTIRGFKDNRFSGNAGFYTNLELRHSSIRKNNYTLQTIAFTDMASINNKTTTLLKKNALSAGIGARLFLPHFYRFVVRFDYARAIEKSDNETINFGVQQFF